MHAHAKSCWTLHQMQVWTLYIKSMFYTEITKENTFISWWSVWNGGWNNCGITNKNTQGNKTFTDEGIFAGIWQFEIYTLLLYGYKGVNITYDSFDGDLIWYMWTNLEVTLWIWKYFNKFTGLCK